jgi:hypothetical protein
MNKPLHTLKDAVDAGLVLVAICHNMHCRHGQLVNLDLVVHHVGAAHSLVPVRGKPHFSERMRCPNCKYLGMFIWTEIRKDPEPFLNSQGYVIKNWDKSSGAVISELGRVGHVSLAHAAYNAALGAYPGRRITLQEGGFVLRDSRFKIVSGG